MINHDFLLGFGAGKAAGGGGGGGSVVSESGTYSPAADVSAATITFAQEHTSPPDFYAIFDSTGDDVPSSSIVSVVFVNFYGLGATVSISGSEKYAVAFGQEPTTSMAAKIVTHPPAESKPTNYTYYDFWCTSTGITPSLATTSRYFKSGRSYKWIAVWMS